VAAKQACVVAEVAGLKFSMDKKDIWGVPMVTKRPNDQELRRRLSRTVIYPKNVARKVLARDAFRSMPDVFLIRTGFLWTLRNWWTRSRGRSQRQTGMERGTL
jgi:hypothetical protein